MNMIHNPPISDDLPQPVADICTQDLFGEANVITIAHQQMVYTLRITRQGKLLLTK